MYVETQTEKEMKMDRKGFAPTVILLVVVAVLVVAGGIWYYESHRQISQPTIAGTPAIQTVSQTSTVPATLSASCGDFEALQNYVTKTIAPPDQQGPMQMDPNVITSFDWKRAAGEPWITYPIIQGYSATYGVDGHESNSAIRATIRNDANAIGRTITAEANSLGLVADNLNTLPFQSFTDQDAYHAVYGFRSGSDLYSLVVRSDSGTQAPADGTVMVTCGRAVAGYDALYSALRLKADPTIENPYDNDVVAVQAVSADSTVYALSGYPQTDDLGSYYYFDDNAAKLVSSGSYPAQCGVLEAQKVGLGMRCVDLNDRSSVVTYGGSQTMQNLDNTSFLVVDGLSFVSPPGKGLLAYFWISISSNLNNNNARCSIYFGDGSSTPLFPNSECSGHPTSSIFHYYANHGTYTANIIGTWKSGNQQMTEVLATTTVTTNN
jgi:hypothetical protein